MPIVPPCTITEASTTTKTDLVDALRVGDVASERERGEEDRHGALQPAPDHEQALAGSKTRRSEQHAERERTGDQRGKRREQQAVHPAAGRQRGEIDRQSERDEHDDLGQRGEPVLEDVDLGAERRAQIADDQAGDEHGEEPRAVRDRRDAEDEPGERERAQRVEPRGRKRRRAASERARRGRPRCRSRARSTSAPRRLAMTIQNERIGVRRELDHSEHQRDADRVVRARLAFEDRAGAAA